MEAIEKKLLADWLDETLRQQSTQLEKTMVSEFRKAVMSLPTVEAKPIEEGAWKHEQKI